MLMRRDARLKLANSRPTSGLSSRELNRWLTRWSRWSSRSRCWSQMIPRLLVSGKRSASIYLMFATKWRPKTRSLETAAKSSSHRELSLQMQLAALTTSKIRTGLVSNLDFLVWMCCLIWARMTHSLKTLNIRLQLTRRIPIKQNTCFNRTSRGSQIRLLKLLVLIANK